MYTCMCFCTIPSNGHTSCNQPKHSPSLNSLLMHLFVQNSFIIKLYLDVSLVYLYETKNAHKLYTNSYVSPRKGDIWSEATKDENHDFKPNPDITQTIILRLLLCGETNIIISIIIYNYTPFHHNINSTQNPSPKPYCMGAISAMLAFINELIMCFETGSFSC